MHKRSIEEWATLLNGREYGAEISPAELSEAIGQGVLIVYGQSDDQVVLAGDDTVYIYNDGDILIDKEGLLPSWDDDEERNRKDAWEYFARFSKHAEHVLIKVAFCDISGWKFETSAKCAAHFEIMEDGNRYGGGLAIDLRNLC